MSLLIVPVVNPHAAGSVRRHARCLQVARPQGGFVKRKNDEPRPMEQIQSSDWCVNSALLLSSISVTRRTI